MNNYEKHQNTLEMQQMAFQQMTVPKMQSENELLHVLVL
jgi:hypothetical protein